MHARNTISALRISLASPEQIRQWSHGEVTKPDTINYLTHEPEPGGLCCERIFGPMRDWSCACGKYRHIHKVDVTCEKCGVTLAPATVRREWMGHIELAAPIVHPWFLRGASPIGLLLNLSSRQLAMVMAFQCYLVLSVDEQARAQMLTASEAAACDGAVLLARLQPGMLLDTTDYETLSLHAGHVFQAKTGAEALRDALDALDLERLAHDLRQSLQAADGHQRNISTRLHAVEAFRTSGLRPSWMILTVLAVLPADLRPIVSLDGRLAASDVNTLYARVIHRNTRLKHCIEHHAPTPILNHERRFLQHACNALFDNAHQHRPVPGPTGYALKSLTDQLQGKRGRFRHNLLGKRVDYSGRSVIVVGCDLLLHECGLPKEMACELFKPFIMRKLIERRYARTPRQAKRMVERRVPVFWDMLAEVVYERVVLLNRAPTLHRLSIQAFQPRLIEGHALELHPLVCSAFNADFDGDQMAVHVPLSEAAQDEAQRLLLSTRNLRHPASGEPAVTPSQEMVLGCFYLTEERPDTQSRHRVLSGIDEARMAYEVGSIDLHTPILVRLPHQQVYAQPPPAPTQLPTKGCILTTVGRLLLNEVLPDTLGYRNYPMTKEQLRAVVAESLTRCGTVRTAQMLDDLKRLGYHYATRSGISFALSDIKIPPEREVFIEQGQQRVQEVDVLYHQGEITAQEWSRQVIAIWSEVTERISAILTEVLDPFGTLMTIVKSGATKARFQQIRQLSGIRGLMASPSGAILPVPVLSNYLLGLLTWEVFIAASGARKGFMDRSLNTAMSGYLTRRLVEAGMEVWITQQDCGTTHGLLIGNEESRQMGLPTMRSRVLGRVLAEAVDGMEAGIVLDASCVDTLLTHGVEQVRVRSPLTCEASYGLCQRCYGLDLTTGALVRLGSAVGVIAGQSIGEPGTQLTMRTFHSGGIANAVGDITQGLPRVNALFEARIPVRAAPLAPCAGVVCTLEQDSRTGAQHIMLTASVTQERQRVTLLPGYTCTVREGQVIEAGTPLAEGPCNPHDIVRLQGLEAAQRYLLQEVQRAYRATGVFMHDKHLEVILRQMGRYVVMVETGDTALVPGEIIDRFVYLQHTADLLAQGGSPPLARPVLLGLTRAILQTHSWIAAASFQDTRRVLVQAAIRAQLDSLRGFKERLMVGKKLPAV